MSDIRPSTTDAMAPTPPATWHDAFARLPQDAPPAGGWDALQSRLGANAPPAAPARPHWPLWTALAASLLLAVALPVYWHVDPAPAPTSAPAVAVAPGPGTGASVADAPAAARLDALRDESARLEALLPLISDDRVASGSAALMTDELELHLAEIDADLRAPALTPHAEQTLWEARVQTLYTLARLEAERSWLAAQGSRFDTALVRID